MPGKHEKEEDMSKIQRFKIATAASALILLSACATAPATKNDGAAAPVAASAAGQTADAVVVSEDPKAPLERRVTDRWKLLVAKDAARAYGYLTPGYRATTTPAQYEEWMRTRQIKWTAGKYVDRHCDDTTTCSVSVDVSIETKMPGIPGVQASAGVIEESWLQIEGVWYHLPKIAR
jgi:hypothetical protein